MAEKEGYKAGAVSPFLMYAQILTLLLGFVAKIAG
jgi:hypothetical protein